MADSEQLVHKLRLALGVVGTAFGIILIALLWLACHLCCARLKSKYRPHVDSPAMIYCPSSAHLTSPYASSDTKIPYTGSRFSLEHRTSPTTPTHLGGYSYSEQECQTTTTSPTTTAASCQGYSQYTSPKDPNMTSNSVIMNTPGAPQPVRLQYHPPDMSYGSDPPLECILPHRSDTRPAKRHSSYTPIRANAVSYYHAADSVVGTVPRPMSTISVMPDLRFGGPKLGLVSNGEEEYSRRGNESV
ncbi:hypothetical protein BJ165DRAFT_1452685 [Panaeolus papilionaceus]|nr:hypothetical protein BJ165DRAFT_1452685 [Panaeolus papilionaceus]